jgi:hypothetical protein
MPGSNERDSLDDWLDREVRPLPPPSGTFEMITKRARRRKARKLAITVTSAAVVAAAAVVAVPTVLTLHLNTPSANGISAGQTFSPSATAPSSSALIPTPTQAPTSAMGSTASAPTNSLGVTPNAAPAPGGPVPANFQPTSVTFVSASEGWAIGQAGTPGKCANADPAICTSMVRTNDRGRTWAGVPAPSTSRVEFIRFLDGVNGWAFGPELWSTHDRGNTWTQVDTGGQYVTSLEASGSRAYAVFSSCPSSSSCTNTLKSASADTDNWAPVSPATTGVAYSVNALTAGIVVLGGGQGWFLLPNGTLYTGSLAGGAWLKLGTPSCPASVPVLNWSKPSGALDFACSSPPGTSQQSWTTTTYTSSDEGQHWSAGTSRASSGAVRSLSGSPGAAFILATTAGIDVAGTTAQGKPAASLAEGFSYVGMTGNNQGVAIPADSSLHEIYMTYDGGLTWTPVKVIP